MKNQHFLKFPYIENHVILCNWSCIGRCDRDQFWHCHKKVPNYDQKVPNAVAVFGKHAKIMLPQFCKEIPNSLERSDNITKWHKIQGGEGTLI